MTGVVPIYNKNQSRVTTYVEIVALEFGFASERLGPDKVCWHAHLIWWLLGREGTWMITEVNFYGLGLDHASAFTGGAFVRKADSGLVSDHPRIHAQKTVVFFSVERILAKILSG